MKRTVTTLLAIAIVGNVLAAQPAAITEAQARQAAMAAATAKNFGNAFRDEIRKIQPDYTQNVVWLLQGEYIQCWIMGPLSRFQQDASDAVRKMEPIDQLAFANGVAISLLPRRMDTMNVEKIVVTRAGTVIEPTSGGFVPVELTNAMGGKVSLGAGIAVYPSAAFAPGAVVTVTIIPVSGDNVIKTLRDADLKKIR